MGKKKCPTCEAPLRDRARWCDVCGEKLAEPEDAADLTPDELAWMRERHEAWKKKHKEKEKETPPPEDPPPDDDAGDLY